MPVIFDEIIATHLSPGNAGQPQSGPVKLTPEQIRQVADRVYAMLLEDIRIEAERSRPAVKRGNMVKGSRF